MVAGPRMERSSLRPSRGKKAAIESITKGDYACSYTGGLSVNALHSFSRFQNCYCRGSGCEKGENIGASWGEKCTSCPNNVEGSFDNSATYNSSIRTDGGSEKVKGYISYS